MKRYKYLLLCLFVVSVVLLFVGCSGGQDLGRPKPVREIPYSRMYERS